jgi:hypothetical protein
MDSCAERRFPAGEASGGLDVVSKLKCPVLIASEVSGLVLLIKLVIS